MPPVPNGCPLFGMSWDAERASAEHQREITAFVETQTYVRWGAGRRVAVASAVLVLAQAGPAFFVLAMWDRDRLGALIAMAFTDALLLGLAAWFAIGPRSFARWVAKAQNPPPVDPRKWNPWLGGGG